VVVIAAMTDLVAGVQVETVFVVVIEAATVKAVTVAKLTFVVAIVVAVVVAVIVLAVKRLHSDLCSVE